MSPRETLLKMRGWIEVELKKAEKPYQDPCVLLSLRYSAEKALGIAEAQEVLTLLRSAANTERQVGTYDVVGPHAAIFLINCALAKC